METDRYFWPVISLAISALVLLLALVSPQIAGIVIGVFAGLALCAFLAYVAYQVLAYLIKQAQVDPESRPARIQPTSPSKSGLHTYNTNPRGLFRELGDTLVGACYCILPIVIIIYIIDTMERKESGPTRRLTPAEQREQDAQDMEDHYYSRIGR